MTALGALRKGGTFILKDFTLLESFSVSLLYLLAMHFNTITIIKPFTARHGNSELYVAATQFNGISDELLQRYRSILFTSLFQKCHSHRGLSSDWPVSCDWNCPQIGRSLLVSIFLTNSLNRFVMFVSFSRNLDPPSFIQSLNT